MTEPAGGPSFRPRAAGWLSAPRMRVRTKIAVAVSAAMLLVTSLLTYFVYRMAFREVTAEFGRKLMSVAASGAMDIDGAEHSGLQRPEQMHSPEYRRIQRRLRRLRNANSHIRLRYVYTMSPTDTPGIWRYVVDSESERSRSFSVLGATEDFYYNPVWLKPLEQPMAESELRYYPGWGAMISASAPIRDRAGRSVGVLSVDAQAGEVITATRDLRLWALIFAALGLALSLAVSFPLAWQVTRPISALIAGTQAVARGDFSRQVVIPNRDELGDLAQAFNRMTEGLKERELYRRQFERYVSRQIAEKVLANPEKAFWDAERRKATILFSDIRGFTAMAENRPPEDVIGRLNQYLSLMIDIVFEHEGTLDKFMGDAVMAVFGAPVSLGNDEERAVRTAAAMQRTARELASRWEQEGFPSFQIGIGIHTGDVVVGNIGSERRMEYSAIGDTVNLASRLESLNKDYKTSVLISETTHAAVAPLVEARFVDRVSVRGREQPVGVYELISLRET